MSSYMNVPQSITGTLLHIFCDDKYRRPFNCENVNFMLLFVGGQIRRKLLSILDSISLSQTYPEAIQLEFFDPSAIDRLITGCEQKSSGVGFCNVKVLHKLLMTELNNIQGATAGIDRDRLL